MKKLLLLSILPILLFSCSKGETAKQKEVNYACMLISLKHSSECRKAHTLTATYTYIEQTDNWEIIGYSGMGYDTGYERPNYQESWSVDLTLNIEGGIISEYDPESVVEKAYLIDYSTIVSRYDRMLESEGTDFVKFYLHPSRIFYCGSWQYHDTNYDNDAYLNSYYEFDEVFNKEQWITTYTIYEYQYVYNDVTGVSAYRKITRKSEFKYHSYY